MTIDGKISKFLLIERLNSSLTVKNLPLVLTNLRLTRKPETGILTQLYKAFRVSPGGYAVRVLKSMVLKGTVPWSEEHF